jgi:hypothetical protein
MNLGFLNPREVTQYSNFSAIHLTIEILGHFLFLLVQKVKERLITTARTPQILLLFLSPSFLSFLPSETMGKPG